MSNVENFFIRLAVPAVALLISFLSYTSQILFRTLEPGPLEVKETIIFNVLLACIWICYARSWLTDPGFVPRDWMPAELKPGDGGIVQDTEFRHRYCRKCDAFKAPRSHHCKMCKRCIPKMDHHCPWTGNCVSHRTFPHFIRFLFYAVAAMSYLEYFIYVRALIVWENRNLPSYLGPSAIQLVHLFFLITANSLTLFLVSIMFFRALWGLSMNVTTIESWEIERHEQLLRRARAFGGYLDGPDGIRIRIVRQEFPYDVGIWINISEGMGTANPLAWLWPFAATPTSSGLTFPENGFEDPGKVWPPPDPDRIPRLQRSFNPAGGFTYQQSGLTTAQEVEAFKGRQRADLERRSVVKGLQRRKPFHARYQDDGSPLQDDFLEEQDDDGVGEEDWQDSGGNRLTDYGVEQEVDFYDEDIPLGELLRRRRERRKVSS